MKHLLRFVPMLLVPALASASTVWKGDFETGNLSQWDRQQVVSSNRLLVQTEFVREGRYALKATVRQGDDPIGASGNRNELVYMSLEPSGTEYYYKWSTYFPASFPRSERWQIFAQWHHEGSNGSPPLELYIIDDEMRLRAGGVSGPVVWRAPLERGRWHDFVLRVKWSSDPKVGFVELYRDGELELPKRYVSTQFRGDRNYLKLGLYRDASISPVGIVYHDGFTVATKLADVMPPKPPPPAEEEPVVVSPPTPPAPPAPPEETPEPSTPEPSMPEPQEPPVLAIPTDATPPFVPPTDNTVLPGDPGGDPMQGSEEMAPAGCGASTTGGLPLVAAALLLSGWLLRRRHAPVPVRRSQR